MRRIVYHVAVSLDGFISGSDGSVDGFPHEGEHVNDYMDELQHYDTALMGRRTYEFGYRYGMQPGQGPYPHMQHFIFSGTLHLPPSDNVKVISEDAAPFAARLKEQDGGTIYLCGGGLFAGAMLRAGLVDELLLKLCPITYGSGVKLFENEGKLHSFRLLDLKRYDSGILLLKYRRRNQELDPGPEQSQGPSR